MNRRAPIAHACPQIDRALAAATEILRLINDANDDPDLPAGELLCRIWRFLILEFDDIEREARNEI